MNIEIKEVERFKITESFDIDPITVYIDEWKKGKDSGEPQYQGRITIVCYDTVLSYYWDSMAEPLKEFFCSTSIEYLASKFINSAYSSYCPIVRSTSSANEFLGEKVSVEMSDTQQEYIKKVIKAVQQGLEEVLERSKIQAI